MLYLEDYLEVIEHLPQELRDRFTDIRTRDLQVHNSSENLREKGKSFFAQAKKLKPEQKKCEYDKIIEEYAETMKYAEDKIQISDQMHEIMVNLIQRLDLELEKFKLELEADHAGITGELEKRSLELDRADDELANGFDSNSKGASKDRRRSEFKNRHIHSNGYSTNSVGRPRLSHKKHHQHHINNRKDSNGFNNPMDINTNRSVDVSDQLFRDDFGHTVRLHNNGLPSFGNPGFKHLKISSNSPQYKSSNTSYDQQQHSALSAALASSPTMSQFNPISAFALMNSHQNKISSNSATSSIEANSSLANMQQNLLAAAASQAIAATQQLQQGRRTPSLKASFAAINGVNEMNRIGPGDSLSKHDIMASGNRNALAPMAHDYLSVNGNQTFNKFNNQLKHQGSQINNGLSTNNTNPLYISVTKSGRPTKRPRHHASHLYPDESPTSISSNNSIFENSESLSSADFLETGTTFNSSPNSFDFANNSQPNTLYQRDETRYCICRQVSYGEMVACDNDECEFEWFHYDCVGIESPPKGEWFCESCLRNMPNQQNQPQAKKRGRKEKVNDSGVVIKQKT